MKLSEYFEKSSGYGILATADIDGKVDAALYARPHFLDENTVLFIMAERLTHKNLGSNPYATYLFIEEGTGYSGKRLYLRKIREEQNNELLKEICRKCDYSHYNVTSKHIVYFTIEKILPLIGTG